jgi:arsenate reductase
MPVANGPGHPQPRVGRQSPSDFGRHFPQRKVADGAIEALKLAGLQTENLSPKTVEAVMDEPIDLVVSVCDNAKESCPIFPRPVKRIHVGFHDPHGESLDSFIAVRDDIRARLCRQFVKH